MSYFRELPDLYYQSPLSTRTSSKEYVRIKNLFRRVKLRDDLQNVFTLFNKYEIGQGERPDTIAEDLYGSNDLDWVVMMSAGIINLHDQWPLSDYDLYRYADNKYGNDLNAIRFYETTEVKDSSGRLVLPKKTAADDLQIGDFLNWDTSGVEKMGAATDDASFIGVCGTLSEDADGPDQIMVYLKAIVEVPSESAT